MDGDARDACCGDRDDRHLRQGMRQLELRAQAFVVVDSNGNEKARLS